MLSFFIFVLIYWTVYGVKILSESRCGGTASCAIHVFTHGFFFVLIALFFKNQHSKEIDTLLKFY